MPKYLVEMHDGRKFQVEADSPPTEDEVMAHLGGSAPKPSEPAQGVLGHPMNVQEGEPSTVDNLNDMMRPMAHPQSLGDVAGLLLPDNIGALASKAGALAAKPVASLARGAASALESVPGLKNIIPFANPAKSIIPFDKMAGRLRTIAQTAQDADMGVTRGADMFNMERFPRSTESTARVPMMHGEPGVTSAEERIKALVDQSVADGKLRRAPEVPEPPMQSIRERFPNGAPSGMPAETGGVLRTTSAPVQPMASHAPTGKSAAFAEIPNDPAMEEIVNRMSGGADAPSLGNGAMPSEMQQPRVDVGAQKVGRANGLTKEQVRQQTAPIVGEAQGEASPILPEKALQNIIDKMRSLPKGGPEREAYVQAATSGKTRGQVENIRRTLEHLGLIVPAAAAVPSSVRDMLLQRMRAGVTGGSGSEQ